MQVPLIEIPSQSNGLRDSSFSKNRCLPIHRWVPWIAGFSSEFVADCISKYLPSESKRQSWVMDPFAGVGTTLVEAYTQGFNVLGFEINPYAALASTVKLQASCIDAKAVRAQPYAFERLMRVRCGSTNGNPRAKAPEGFSGRTQLSSPAVERKVLFALDFINGIQIPIIRDLFESPSGRSWSASLTIPTSRTDPSNPLLQCVGRPKYRRHSSHGQNRFCIRTVR